MATGPITQISDVIVPELFTPYVRQLTEQKSRLINSGAVVRNPRLDAFLDGPGLTVNVPSMSPLDDDAENISSDEADDRITGLSNNSVPKKITTSQETAVRLSRNQSWSSADLVAALSAFDPLQAVSEYASSYWARRLQAAFVATVNGVFADNAAAPTGTEHSQDDMTADISGVSYTAGTTDFSTSAFIDATVTMGDSMEDLGLVMTHSIVFARMQKNNLIDFIVDSESNVRIPTYLGRTLIVDDSMPASGGVYETWLLGRGAIQFGSSSPKKPTAVKRDEDAGNGGGAEILYSRVEWTIHPTGHAYVGVAPDGGPSNAATSNNLANADSWKRAYSERKQIKMARLITREHA